MATSKPPPKPKTRRGSGRMQFLTQEELKRLLAVINDKRDKALFLLAYRHRLRASEVGLLQRTDVDLKQGRITIHRLKPTFRTSLCDLSYFCVSLEVH
jgi:integrase